MAFTIASPITFEEEIKKSRFQAIAAPVENEQQVKEFLEHVVPLLRHVNEKHD